MCSLTILWTLLDKSTSVVSITNATQSVALMNATAKLRDAIGPRDANSRKDNGDDGYMVAYGRRNGGAKEFVDKSRRGKFQEETYKITRENKKLALALPPTCKEMRKFANDKFPDWVLEMERHMKDTSVEIPEVMVVKMAWRHLVCAHVTWAIQVISIARMGRDRGPCGERKYRGGQRGGISSCRMYTMEMDGPLRLSSLMEL